MIPRTLVLISVLMLPACTSGSLVVPKGVYLNHCLTHATVEPSANASCMPRAQDRTARKEALRAAESIKEEDSLPASGKSDKRIPWSS